MLILWRRVRLVLLGTRSYRSNFYPRCFTAPWLQIRITCRKWRVQAGLGVSVAGHSRYHRRLAPPGFDITATLAWGLDNIEGSDEKPAHPSIFVACDYVAGWLATCGVLSALLRRAKEGGSYRVVVSLSRTALWLAELGIFLGLKCNAQKY